MSPFPGNVRPPRFLAIWVATVLLFAAAFVLAPASVSGSSLATAFSFAAVLAIASIGQTLVVQQGGLDLTVPGVISLAAVIVTKFPNGDDSCFWRSRAWPPSRAAPFQDYSVGSPS